MSPPSLLKGEGFSFSLCLLLDSGGCDDVGFVVGDHQRGAAQCTCLPPLFSKGIVVVMIAFSICSVVVV